MKKEKTNKELAEFMHNQYVRNLISKKQKEAIEECIKLSSEMCLKSLRVSIQKPKNIRKK